MTTSAPAGCSDISIAFEANFTSLFHAGKIGRIIERAEVVRGVIPAVVSILMALHAIGIHHQRFLRDKRSGGGDGFRGEEIFFAFARSLGAI